MEVVMSNEVNLDRVRSAALNRIERSERNFKLAIYSAVAWEAIFLIAFILGMERHNRLHMLLLISTVGIYTVVLLGLVALGAHVSRCTQRVLKAVELLDQPPTGAVK